MYVYTLDCHNCFGPFKSEDEAKQWANETLSKYNTWQVLVRPPFRTTLILPPYKRTNFIGL